MQNEIELKIMLSPENVAKIKAWLMAQSDLQHQIDELSNTYFDTPEQFFSTQQMGFRVRGKNNQYEMTLKTKGNIVGGLHIRPEYNLALSSSEPDFKRLNSHFDLQMANAEAIHHALIPTFSTDFVRHKWIIQVNQSEIEVALDEGTIKNTMGEATICELELELRSGDLADIFTLLEKMPRSNGMWFSGLSKAQRGYLVGNSARFRAEIDKALAKENGYSLEQKLADYLRQEEDDETLMTIFYQRFPDFPQYDVKQLGEYLKSATYFDDNLVRLKALI